LKKSAFPGGCKPELLVALIVAEGCYDEISVNMVVTSMNDSKHKDGSLHYDGYAADLRTKSVPRPQLHDLVADIKDSLPDCYDVILESEAQAQEHIHLEFDVVKAAKMAAPQIA